MDCFRVGILTILSVFISFVSCQTSQASTQAVSFCPLYLVLQNRCPSPSTTLRTSTTRTTTVSGNDTESSESDVVDSCGVPMITFCPSTLFFLSGDRNCTNGQTIRIGLTTLGRLLVRPSQDRAAAIVGANNVESLGDTLTSISNTIQTTTTQSQAANTIGVTFIPVGQLIGGK